MADPTGMDAVLAQIQPGALSERQQRIANGLALIRDQKYDVKSAAKMVGIPHSTLWRYNRDGFEVKPECGIERDIEALVDVTADIALMAGEHIRDSIASGDDDWKPADLVRAYSAANDKLMSWTQRGGQKPDDGQSAITKLLAGATIQMAPAPRDGDQAINVEAERVETD